MEQKHTGSAQRLPLQVLTSIDYVVTVRYLQWQAYEVRSGAVSQAVPPGPTTEKPGGGVRKHGPGAGRN